jgi:hypothetical protein
VLFRGRWWADVLGAAKRRAERLPEGVETEGGRS